MAQREATKLDYKTDGDNRLDFDHHRDERHRLLRGFVALRSSAMDHADQADGDTGDDHDATSRPSERLSAGR
jgi:hypothetical protein